MTPGDAPLPQSGAIDGFVRRRVAEVGTLCGMGEHDKPKPDPEPNDDGQAPGVPPEPDPGKHGKK